MGVRAAGRVAAGVGCQCGQRGVCSTTNKDGQPSPPPPAVRPSLRASIPPPATFTVPAETPPLSPFPPIPWPPFLPFLQTFSCHPSLRSPPLSSHLPPSTPTSTSPHFLSSVSTAILQPYSSLCSLPRRLFTSSSTSLPFHLAPPLPSPPFPFLSYRPRHLSLPPLQYGSSALPSFLPLLPSLSLLLNFLPLYHLSFLLFLILLIPFTHPFFLPFLLSYHHHFLFRISVSLFFLAV